MSNGKSYIPVPTKGDEGRIGESGTGNPGESRDNNGTASGAGGKTGGGKTGGAAGGAKRGTQKGGKGANNPTAKKEEKAAHRQPKPLAPPMARPVRTGNTILASAKAASEALTATLRGGTSRNTSGKAGSTAKGAGGSSAGGSVLAAAQAATAAQATTAAQKATAAQAAAQAAAAQPTTAPVAIEPEATKPVAAAAQAVLEAGGSNGTGGFSLIGTMGARSRTGVAGTADDQPGWTPPAARYDGQPLHLYPGGSAYLSSFSSSHIMANKMDCNKEASNSRDPPHHPRKTLEVGPKNEQQTHPTRGNILPKTRGINSTFQTVGEEIQLKYIQKYIQKS